MVRGESGSPPTSAASSSSTRARRPSSTRLASIARRMRRCAMYPSGPTDGGWQAPARSQRPRRRSRRSSSDNPRGIERAGPRQRRELGGFQERREHGDPLARVGGGPESLQRAGDLRSECWVNGSQPRRSPPGSMEFLPGNAEGARMTEPPPRPCSWTRRLPAHVRRGAAAAQRARSRAVARPRTGGRSRAAGSACRAHPRSGPAATRRRGARRGAAASASSPSRQTAAIEFERRASRERQTAAPSRRCSSGREQLVAPVHRLAQRPVASRGEPTPRDEELESIAKPHGDLVERERPWPARPRARWPAAAHRARGRFAPPSRTRSSSTSQLAARQRARDR